MACKPGDLVLIPFPFSDLQSTKKRPVMVLTPPDRHADFIGLAITTVEQQQQALLVEETHLIQGTLPRPSWIRVDKIFTLSESSIIKTFGTLSPQTVQRVLKGLCAVVGYARE
ncbi:MAG: type II toxin-antitoxin system PemK/MazF family toxin [Nitrospira sp.]|nr:type II toxin-antitoxin system PemK/MazF family toxin [Nitrospira sp.]MDR4476031.1 type II toxin-antitoxin system PemK/MazF family toxin [Nitrospira sp.]